MTDDSRPRGYFHDRATHQWTLPFPGEQVAIHVDGRQTNQRFACAEALLEPGVGQPLHIHRAMEELLYVLEGEIDFVLEGKRFRGGAGALVFIPRGAVHTFRNLGNRPARMLGMFSPSAMDGFFEVVKGQPASALAETARHYGIEIVGSMIELEPA